MTDPLRTILDLFARSPFKPLNEHAQKVKITVEKMDEAIKAYLDNDPAKVESLYREISSLEHGADEVKHRIRENLPSTVLMPIDRTDILTFLKQQDDVANSAESVAQLLYLKMIEVPEDVKRDILKLESGVLLTMEEHVDAVGKIIDALDTSFSQKSVKEIEDIINKVDSQKHNVDVIKLETMKTIYDHEHELGAVGPCGGCFRQAEDHDRKKVIRRLYCKEIAV